MRPSIRVNRSSTAMAYRETAAREIFARLIGQLNLWRPPNCLCLPLLDADDSTIEELAGNVSTILEEQCDGGSFQTVDHGWHRSIAFLKMAHHITAESYCQQKRALL